ELDRVSQSLLGVQQDRASLQRVLSEPERTAIAAALRGHPGSQPTPFVFLKTAAKVADGQQGYRLIEVGVGKILSQFERPGTARQGLIVTVEHLQREAAIVQRLDVIRCERQRSVVSGNRFRVAPQVEQT